MEAQKNVRIGLSPFQHIMVVAAGLAGTVALLGLLALTLTYGSAKPSGSLLDHQGPVKKIVAIRGASY